MQGIYKITNKINGKFYIGLSVDIKRRFSEHKSPCRFQKTKTPIARAIKKYGLTNFSFDIIELVECKSKLCEREVFWINKMKPEYNLTSGGDGVRDYVVSEEVKEILREYGKKQWNSLTEVEKQKRILNNLKGQPKGHIVSESTRNKLRECNLGKKMSEETKNKISKANSVSMKGNKSGNKKVVAFNNHEELLFDSIVSASKYFNCHPSNISKVIKGKQKSCKGYNFRYGV